jgi:hypothetical protein
VCSVHLTYNTFGLYTTVVYRLNVLCIWMYRSFILLAVTVWKFVVLNHINYFQYHQIQCVILHSDINAHMNFTYTGATKKIKEYWTTQEVANFRLSLPPWMKLEASLLCFRAMLLEATCSGWKQSAYHLLFLDPLYYYTPLCSEFSEKKTPCL